MNSNPNNQVLYIETSIRPGLTINEYRRTPAEQAVALGAAQAARRRRAGRDGLGVTRLPQGVVARKPHPANVLAVVSTRKILITSLDPGATVAVCDPLCTSRH